MKTCIACKQQKPAEDFYRGGTARDGRFTECKDCNRARAREWQRRKRATDPAYARRARLKWRYGITTDQYDSLLARQDGGCAICGATDPGGRGKDLFVDHDHATGCVRGLLCQGCNAGLGNFGDSLDRLTAAAAYLLAHQHEGAPSF